MGKGKLIIAAIMILLLGMAPDVSALPAVGTTTVSSGQVPTASNWNTYLNRAENWINTNLLNSGNTFTIVGGDSALFNGTVVVDSFRVTGFFDLATHILPRATRTYRIGLPTRLLWALHADTVEAAIANIDTLQGTVIFGATPLLRPSSDQTGSLGRPTFRWQALHVDSLVANATVDSTDIKDGAISGGDLASMLSGRKTFTNGISSGDSLVVTSGNFRSGTSNFIVNGSSVNIGTVKNSAFLTTGLIVNQGGADDDIVALKSSDVAHGITNLIDTDTYTAFSKAGATTGGVEIIGYSSSIYGMILRGFYTTAATAKATNADAAIMIDTALKSGAGITGPGADANLVSIAANTVVRFIFDQEGTGHADDVWTDNAYDLAEEYDVSGLDIKTTTVSEETPISNADSLLWGTVMTYDLTADNMLTPTTSENQMISGVISYHTAQLKNTFGNLTKKYSVLKLKEYSNPKSVGIVGLIPTKVCNGGGNIARGDMIVSSSKKGVGMKGNPILVSANHKTLVGIALSGFVTTNSDSVGIINVQR